MLETVFLANFAFTPSTTVCNLQSLYEAARGAATDGYLRPPASM